MTRLPETWSETRRLGVVRIISSLIYQQRSFSQIVDYFINTRSILNDDISSRFHPDVQERKLRKLLETGIPGSRSVVRNYLRLMKGMNLIEYNLKENLTSLPDLFLLNSLEKMYDQRKSFFELLPIEKIFFVKLLLNKDASLFLPSLSVVDDLRWPWHKIDTKNYADFCKRAADMLGTFLYKIKAQERFNVRKQIRYLQDCEAQISRRKKVRAGIRHLLIPRICWMLDLSMIDFSRSIQERRMILKNEWKALVDKTIKDASKLHSTLEETLLIFSKKLPKSRKLKEYKSKDGIIEFCIQLFGKYFPRLIPLDELSDLVYFSFLLTGKSESQKDVKKHIISLPSVTAYRGMYGDVKFIEYR